jgi:hypothetical protein
MASVSAEINTRISSLFVFCFVMESLSKTSAKFSFSLATLENPSTYN